MRSKEEMEVALYQNAADRKTWQVFSDDPYWQRKLEKAGAVLLKTEGESRFYSLRQDQVLVRTGKRAVSEAQRANAAERMKSMKKPNQDTGTEG